MTNGKTYPLSPESRALIERLLKERNEAHERLEMAVIATKAALGVPLDYDIRSLDVGFEAREVTQNGIDN